MEQKQVWLLVLLLLNLCLAGVLSSRHMYEKAHVDMGIEEEKRIALTFDDGPHPTYTKQLLDGLKERSVKATFFLIGTNVEGQEALVERMSEEGHLIGGHTYRHVELTKVPIEVACEEIERTNRMIEKIIEKQVLYIRPPYGLWSKELETLINQTFVLWDVDPADWKGQSADSIITSVMDCVKEDDIILLHDVYETSVQAALEIVDRLQEKGYTFVTVDEILLD